jgi:TRAP-type C4-dicarboxylate transport system permease small subunit
MKKNYSATLPFIAEILSILFSYSFVFYLILYLLETILPGFVTDNFSLNWILIPTLLFGVLSAIFPTPEDESKTKEIKKTSLFDLIFTIALSIGSFFLIFYKFKIDNLTLKWVVSLLSSILTLFLGLMLLYFPDDLIEEEEIEAVAANKSKVVKFTFNFKRLLLSRLKIPVPFALIILIVLVIFIPANTAKILHRSSTPITQIIKPTDTLIDKPTEKPLPLADPNIKITVSNAGAEKGEANRISNLFKQAGYTSVEATDSAKNVNDALIEFRDSDSAQADLIEDILKGEYLTVNRIPIATDSAQINVYLGAQPQPIEDIDNYEDENFDFFFN